MKYFKREEFRCKGTSCGPDGKNCGFDTVDYELAEVLDDVREHFGKPITITSGCRCPVHNKSVGGASKSVHMTGQAADFRVKDVHADDVHNYLVGKYPGRYGIGLYHNPGRVHVDVRKQEARW